MANDIPSITEAARQFAHSLPPARSPDGQEALRFARWFGEDRKATDLRPSDLETYVETYGATAPNAIARADALKGFLAYAHKHGILPERLVSHVRVRRPTARQKAIGSSSTQTVEVRLTTAGKAALESELQSLIAERPRIARELHDARADGDVRENAPLDAAREAQGQMEARIRELEGMLRHAVVVEDEEGGSNDVARVGCQVVIHNIANGTQLSYQLVNAAEARPGTGRLSASSPVGQALVGRRVGDEVQVTAPSGIVRFRIESIAT
ncbi:MAG TPA: transcription elongation factor GreA [Dehalococcoidia bacterium]|nr:transcription elongation factor GreA [Dehalococcoidia bacterium]